MKPVKGQNAFTIIELLVVVAIVVVLSIIGTSTFNTYRYRSMVSEAITTVSQIYQSEEVFFETFNCYASAAPYPYDMANPSGVPYAPTVFPYASETYPSGVINEYGGRGLSLKLPYSETQFQYQVYAHKAPHWADRCWQDNALGTIPNPVGCFDNPAAAFVLGGASWFLVVARSDLDQDGQVFTMASGIGDVRVRTCDGEY